MPGLSETNPVAVEHIDGQWAVQVFENGAVYQRIFETEEFANNFAAGQRLRLQAPPVAGAKATD